MYAFSRINYIKHINNNYTLFITRIGEFVIKTMQNNMQL